MRLTRLEIENFKGIGERQVIEIRPITLLFGPNSAGKSTVLQAVEYLHQVLRGNLLDSDTNSASKAGQDWSDFESLVHCHDLKKVIRIKADVRLNESFYDEYFPINLAAQKDRTPLELSNVLGDAKFAELLINYTTGDSQSSKVTDVAVAIEVAWQNAPNEIGPEISGAFLRGLEIDINHQHIITIRPPKPSVLPYEKAIIEVNHKHYLLNDMDSISGADYELSDQSNIYNLQENKRKWEVKHGEEMGAQKEDVEDAAPDFKEQRIISPFSKELFKVIHEIDSNKGEIDSEFGEILISKFDLISLVEYSFYSGYSFDQNSTFSDIKFPVDFISKNTDERTGRWVRLQAIFSEIISAPIQSVSSATESSPASWFSPSSVIGPLRSIPSRRKSGTVLDSTDNLDIIRKVNHWLENRFELDYTIERFKSKLVPEIASKPTKGLEDHIPNKSSHDETITKLYDKRRGIYLDFVDVGVGISQLVPVIVAAIYGDDNFGLIRIEQPELHVHPAIQVELGDLFIESAREHEVMERTFLIETHSEHLLLRLLRRIQESTDNELPPNTVGLKAGDLSVICIEPVRTEKRIRTRIKRMRVDETGEFDWPNGFFDERYGELF